MKAALIITLCSLPFLVDAVEFKDCGSKKGTIKSVMVENCKTAPCPLKRGTNATFTVDFSASEVVTNATSVVHGIVGGVKVPFTIPVPEACDDSGLTCPLKPGKMNAYHTYIPVEKYYPSLEVPVEWELKDQDGVDVFCMVVLVKIES